MSPLDACSAVHPQARNGNRGCGLVDPYRGLYGLPPPRNQCRTVRPVWGDTSAMNANHKHLAKQMLQDEFGVDEAEFSGSRVTVYAAEDQAARITVRFMELGWEGITYPKGAGVREVVAVYTEETPTPEVVPDYTDDCDGCLCSVPRTWAGGPDLQVMNSPFWCDHPSLLEPRKVRGKDAFNSRPDWCPLDEGKQVLIQLRPLGAKSLREQRLEDE